jgi:hypothetical protein
MKNRKPINSFAEAGLGYFSAPDILFENKIKLSHKAQTFYLYVCYETRKNWGKSPTLRTSTILKALDFLPKDMVAVRKELVAQKLLKSTEIRSGEWLYELKNPTTDRVIGAFIPEFHGLEDFDHLDPQLLRTVFEGYGLELKDAGWENNQVFTTCPFHNARKKDTSLGINLDGGGMWSCRTCNASGKLIKFEQSWAEKKGDQVITKKEARRRLDTRINRARTKLAINEPTKFPEELRHKLPAMVNDNAEFMP